MYVIHIYILIYCLMHYYALVISICVRLVRTITRSHACGYTTYHISTLNVVSVGMVNPLCNL